MAKLALETKKIMVKEISSRIGSATTLIVTNYKGLGAQELNELRRELKKAACEYLVVKDSMAKVALKETSNNRLSDLLQGDVGIAASKTDPVALSKILVKFSKDHEPLKIQGGIEKGEFFSRQDIIVYASLPSREVLLTKLAIVLNSPIQGMASALNAIICKLLYALNAVKDKKGGIK
ncbi:MAG: 50S ribosomal protein L10 [Candidatus Omnitrophota bacterium]